MTQSFTGLRLLQPGIEACVGGMLLANETGNCNAYSLSHADRGSREPTKSGYSFGGNQMDLAANPKARALLQDVLEHKGTSGKRLYARIATKLLATGNPWALSVPDEQAVNQALQTPYGRKKTDEAFAGSVRNIIREVKTVIGSLPSGNIRKILEESTALLLYLTDYHNQFHIDAVVLGNTHNGKMYRFLCGEPVLMAGGTTLQLNNTITADDIIRFECHTDYHFKRPNDLPRRHRNIASLLPIGCG